MQRRTFIVGSLSTAALVAQLGPFSPTPAAAAPAPSRFTRWRPRLIDESAVRQARLAQEIRAYAIGVTREHVLHNGAHGVGFWGRDRAEENGVCINPNENNICGHAVPWGDGTRFFTWHREYIARLATHLSTIIIEGRPLTLPSWAPWEPIPSSFLTNGAHNPEISTQLFSAFCDDTIGHFPTDDALGVLLSWGPHFTTHVLTGGDMALVHKAPLSPIFWPWHAFVDDLYRTYRNRRKRFGDFQPIPKENPFTWQPPVGVAPGNRQRRVPFCIGYTREQARRKLLQQGLRLGPTDSNDPNMRVLSQDPLPWTPVTSNSEVKLMMKPPQPGGGNSGDGGLWPPRLPF